MKDALTKLIKVKTIVTIILTIVFAVLSIIGKIEPQQFLTIFAVIISFYFGTVAERQTSKGETTGATSAVGTSSNTSTVVDYGTLESEMEATEDDTTEDVETETDTTAGDDGDEANA